MTQTTAAPARKTLGTRLGTSAKTLHRKAMDKAAAAPAPDGESLEDIFPQEPGNSATAPVDASPARTIEDQPVKPVPAQSLVLATWSDQDERAFRVMAERRRQAGYRARGKNVSGQLLRAGPVVANDGTVMATISAIVSKVGVVSRGDLLDLIAAMPFAKPTVKPTDRGWAQAYVAGAIRAGHLAIHVDAVGAPWADVVLGECSPNAA